VSADLEAVSAQDGAAPVDTAAQVGEAPVTTREVSKAEYVLSMLLRLRKIGYEKDVYVWAKVSWWSLSFF
jgi:hypothetical protein